MKTVFLRVLEAENKARALHTAIRNREAALYHQRFEVDPKRFSLIPRSPFAYWVSDRLRQLFAELPPFEAEGRTTKVGLQTSDDFRFTRAWWELPPRRVRERWFPLAKGGKFSPFYSRFSLLLDWSEDGRELKAFAERTSGTTHWSRNLRNTDYYFRPGLTWPLRGIRFSSQAVPAGCIFSIAGKMAFVPDGMIETWLAVFNSSVFDKLITLFAGKYGGVQYEVGLIRSIVVPHLTQEDARVLEELCRRAWSVMRRLDTRTEHSHAFTVPALLQVEGTSLPERAEVWAGHVRAFQAELACIGAEIDSRCFDLYGITEADRHAITAGFAGGASPEDAGTDANTNEDTGEEESDAADGDAAILAAELVSWAVGVAFGRFDIRLAAQARSIPAGQGPIDPLPVCSPGMLTGDNGLPLASPPHGYPLAFPENGILVDDPGHPRDLGAAVRAVFDVVYGPDATGWWHDAAALFDAKGHDLRRWLRAGFFEHHLKLYSRSPRRAPIFWQLSTPSGDYSVWLYAHRLTRDSLFQLQNDVIAPKVAHEERRFLGLVQGTSGSPSARERKEIAAQEAQVEELRGMLEEVKRVAPLWNPTLDDGVVITMAPLWRLVPQNKTWQKELRSHWDALRAGKYDWSHLAMHLWPERVMPKCAHDRSLAIAHGLEELFWFQDEIGKWQPREIDEETIEALVKKRTSPAVKAALESLLAAPAPSGGGRGDRSRKIAASPAGERT